MTTDSNWAPTSTVLVADPMHLRRAAIATFLAPWAEKLGLELRVGDLSEFSGAADCKLIILSIGGRALGEAECAHFIAQLGGQCPDVPVAVISDWEEPDEMIRAFQVGVRGFLPTSLQPEIARQALTFILGGGSFFPPAALMRMPPNAGFPTNGSSGSPEQPEAPEARAAHSLTVRQQEVLDLLCQGRSNKLIGRQLCMTEATVKVHVRQIMRKLGVLNRTQAALLCASGFGPASANGARIIQRNVSEPASDPRWSSPNPFRQADLLDA